MEITYYNEGTIYKKSERLLNTESNSFLQSKSNVGLKTIVSDYYPTPSPLPSSFLPSSIDFFSVKKDKVTGDMSVKKYYKSEWFCEKEGTSEWYDNKDLDICPALVGKIIATGIEKDVVEIYFDIENVSHMKEISTYYDLPTPLKEGEAFNSAGHNWNLTFLTRNPLLMHIKMGSIKFVNDIPTYFKYYKYVPS